MHCYDLQRRRRMRRISLGNSPDNGGDDDAKKWSSTDPMIPQLWTMSDETYRSMINAHVTRGKSILMFGGPLEHFTYSAWWHPLVVWVPVMCYLFAWSNSTNLLVSCVLFGSGWAMWTVLEYVLHRWVFHLDHWWGPSPHALLGLRNILHFILHGIHHKYPNDPNRVITPVAMTAILAFPIYAWLRLFLPYWMLDPLFAGAFAGYLLYDYTHYSYHISPNPPPPEIYRQFSNTRWFRFMKQRHLRHHFKDDESTFGVSVAFTDHLFGTAGAGAC